MKKQHVQLKESERTQLEELLKQGNLPARKFRRALAILELDRGHTFTAVAQTVGATKQSVSTWAKKQRENGLAGLEDKALFAAIEPLTENRLAHVYHRRTKREFALFCQAVVAAYLEATKIRLLLNNLNAHNASAFYETLPAG